MSWVVGDIHGCNRELNILLGKIPAGETIVFLGDYIDRGPDSKGVVDTILDREGRSICLSGNHESMLLSWFRQPDSPEAKAFLFNGGLDTFRSYGLDEKCSWEDFPEAHRNFYDSLLSFYETDTYIAVHAGLNVARGSDPARQDRADLLWARREWLATEHLWTGKRVFYGHTPAGKKDLGTGILPRYGKKSTGMDTGCVYGGYLSAINPDTGELVQVKSSFSYR